MIPFYKLSGGGNDFLALVECETEPSAAEIRAWCSRGQSVGADGLFLLSPTAGGARMVYFNADGGRARLCLNGTRCAARLALELGWAEGSLVVETDAGPISAGPDGDDDAIALRLPEPIEEPVARTLAAGGHAYAGWSVEVGVPHFVLEWEDDLQRAPVAELGSWLRSHADLGPAGANVHFVRLAPSHFEIRSFERGVEAETLACGTGVVATAAVGLAQGELTLPARALTLGGSAFDVAKDGETWILAGDARILARGELTPAAASVPARRWTG